MTSASTRTARSVLAALILLTTLLGGGVVGLISQGNMKVAMIFPLVMCVALVCLSPFFRRPTNLEAVEEGDKVGGCW